MNRKWLPYVVILVLAAVLLVVKRCNQVASLEKPAPTSMGKNGSTPKQGPAGNSGTTSGSAATDPSSVNRNRGFDRRSSFIEYTKHGACRMDCRHISKGEVEQIMEEGIINYKKSKVNAQPCPEYALEGTTRDGQHIRIVFAQCDMKTKVVTTIDLDTEWSCDCPGDNKKN